MSLIHQKQRWQTVWMQMSLEGILIGWESWGVHISLASILVATGRCWLLLTIFPGVAALIVLPEKNQPR